MSLSPEVDRNTSAAERAAFIQTLSFLACPTTHQKLKINDQFVISDQVLKDYISLGLPVSQITGWLTNESETKAYPIINDVLILIPEWALNYESKQWSLPTSSLIINPFKDFQGNDQSGYEDFGKVFTFKVKTFQSRLQSHDQLIVEFMSSHAMTLRHLRAAANTIKVALDLDFWALQNIKDKNIFKICADATKSCFQAGSIDFAFSNSVHHIPASTTEFYSHVYQSLRPQGRFVGIESQGFFAKIALLIVMLMPAFLRTKVLDVVYAEKVLLSQWLSIPVQTRLRKAGISEGQFIKKLFHVIYSFHRPLGKGSLS